MSNLLSGVVTRGLTATDATSGRVGACGTKLLERALTSTSGRPVCRFPSGSPINPPEHSHAGKRDCFYRARVRQTAVGVLLRNCWCKCLLSDEFESQGSRAAGQTCKFSLMVFLLVFFDALPDVLVPVLEHSVDNPR